MVGLNIIMVKEKLTNNLSLYFISIQIKCKICNSFHYLFKYKFKFNQLLELKNNNFRIDLLCCVARLRSLLADSRKGVLTGAPVPIYPLNIRNTRIVIFSNYISLEYFYIGSSPTFSSRLPITKKSTHLVILSLLYNKYIFATLFISIYLL